MTMNMNIYIFLLWYEEEPTWHNKLCYLAREFCNRNRYFFVYEKGAEAAEYENTRPR